MVPAGHTSMILMKLDRSARSPTASSLQVSSPELLKDVFITKQSIFSGRPYFFKPEAYAKFTEEVMLYDDTPTWKLKKKALHTALKM